MATYTKRALSGSTNGRPIKVAATATPGTLLHTAVTGTSDWDEIWLYVTNTHTLNVNLTIEWGGVTDPDDHIVEAAIPPGELPLLVSPGWVLQNDLVVRAFGSVADVLIVSGFVNRISA